MNIEKMPLIFIIILVSISVVGSCQSCFSTLIVSISSNEAISFDGYAISIDGKNMAITSNDSAEITLRGLSLGSHVVQAIKNEGGYISGGMVAIHIRCTNASGGTQKIDIPVRFMGDQLNDSMLKIEMDTPHENESVDSTLVVKGRLSRDLEKDEHLWIAVKPYRSINDWWPQIGGPIEPVNRVFEGNAILSGENGDKFEISIIVVGDDLNEKIRDWENASRQLNRWNPITQKHFGNSGDFSGKFPIVTKKEIESIKYANATVILARDMQSILDIQVFDSDFNPIVGALIDVFQNHTQVDKGITNSQGKYITYLTSGMRYTISAQINNSRRTRDIVAGTSTKFKIIF